MAIKLLSYSLFLVPVILGCGQPLALPGSELVLETESGEDLSQVPPVTRFRLGGLSELPLSDFWLIEGDISSVSRASLRRHEIPGKLEESRVPLASWREGDVVILAPTEVLDGGRVYSLVGLGVGLIGELQVSTEERPILYRWGTSSRRIGAQVRYCKGAPPLWAGLASPELLAGDSQTLPAGIQWGAAEGAGDGVCLRVLVEDEGRDYFVPPTSFGQWLIEPAPVTIVDSGEEQNSDLNASICQGKAILGGCVRPLGPAFRIDLEVGDYLIEAWAMDAERDPIFRLVSMEERGQFLVGPVEADTLYTLKIVSLGDDAGMRGGAPQQLEMQSDVAAAHFILNEVLADPLGPEPAGEWIEIVNIGNASGSLGGLEIWDDAGGVKLPAVHLDPGQFGLIVSEDFAVGADILPHAEASPVSVPTIGKNGLRNSGETVSLRNSLGVVLSKIPPVASKSGVSIARSELFAPDVHSSFFEHSAPGNSPGAPNVID